MQKRHNTLLNTLNIEIGIEIQLSLIYRCYKIDIVDWLFTRLIKKTQEWAYFDSPFFKKFQ